MYGPNQVGELIIGNTVATQTTVQTFITTAADKAVVILNETGSALPSVNEPFKFLQKTSGDAGKGLNYEFSDIVTPNTVEKVTIKAYSPEIQKLVNVVGFTGNVLPDTTYEVEVRIYNDGGALSVENFAVVQGYYVTGSNVTNETPTTVRDGLLSSLRKNLIRRGDFEIVTTTTAAPIGFTVAGKVQKVVPGKIIGKQIEFDVFAKTFSNAYSLTTITQNSGLLTAVTANGSNPGNGTGKFAVNYEWFVKGMKYDPARETGYPVNFATPYYADITGLYNTIQIKYFSVRKETSVERQYKSLTILINKGTDTPANNASTNTILTSIRTAVGSNAVIPANLPIV